MPRRVITEKDRENFKEARNLQGLTTPTPDIDDYRTKIIKYIPAEVVAAFVTIDSIITAIPNYSHSFYWAIFILLIPTTWFLAYYVSGDPKPIARSIGQAFMASISFIIWVFAIGGPFKDLNWYQEYMGGIILIFFTLIAPIIPEVLKGLENQA